MLSAYHMNKKANKNTVAFPYIYITIILEVLLYSMVVFSGNQLHKGFH